MNILVKTLFLSVPLASCLYAQSIDDYQQEMTKNIGATSDIDIAQGTTRSGEGEGSVEDSFMDAVIYNDINEKSFHRKGRTLIQPRVETFSETIHLATPKSDYIAFATEKAKIMQEQQEKAEREASALENKKPKYFVGGYCVATQRTEIIKASSFGLFNCEMNFGEGKYREIEVFAGIYPDYKREIAIAIPFYATMPNGQRMDMSGVALNVDKTSLNIANEVESYKIRRWVAKYGLSINDVAYKYATMWMSDIRNSLTTMETMYIPTNSGGVVTTTPVQTINTEPPRSSDYFVAMGVELVSKLVAIGAENLLDNTSPLFTIYQGQRVWIEGVIDTDNSKMFGKFQEIAKENKKRIEENNKIFMQKQYEPLQNNPQGSAPTTLGDRVMPK